MARTGFHEFNFTDANGFVWEVRLASVSAIPGDDTDIVATAPKGSPYAGASINFLDGKQSDTAIRDAVTVFSIENRPRPSLVPFLALLLLLWVADGRR
jgi:hypothetical protein